MESMRMQMVQAGAEACLAAKDREIESLRQQLETAQVQLTLCGVAALGHFEGCSDKYKSVSLDDVLRLRQQLAAMTQERNEMERQRDDNWRNATRNLLHLAASQAYAAQLREAVQIGSNLLGSYLGCSNNVMKAALALPQDDTALRIAIANELERMADDHVDYLNHAKSLRCRANELKSESTLGFKKLT